MFQRCISNYESHKNPPIYYWFENYFKITELYIGLHIKKPAIENDFCSIKIENLLFSVSQWPKADHFISHLFVSIVININLLPSTYNYLHIINSATFMSKSKLFMSFFFCSRIFFWDRNLLFVLWVFHSIFFCTKPVKRSRREPVYIYGTHLITCREGWIL